MVTAWDGTNSPPIASSNYEYQSTVKVYDSLGSTHDVTIYYDPTGTAGQWEYIVTCNPAEDARGTAGDQWDGMLGRGLITFNTSSGTVTSLTLERGTGDADPTGTGNVAANANGYMEVAPDFGPGAQNVALNFGTQWDGTTWVNDSQTTTQYARASTTVFQTADGYGAGDLQGVDVDVDGVITGVYSNGQIMPLFRVALAKFQNEQGLHKEGGNLYRETRLSGAAITNNPGTNGLGSIAPNSLEQSNVDIANEFVKMITTQRGFQANGKIITVTDQMLAELIQLKR
jgi:flagellar hook protein FlgE